MRKSMCRLAAVARVTLSAIMLCGLLLAIQPAKADTFYFNDLGTTLTATRTAGSLDTSISGLCSAETCTLLFSQPSGTGPAIAIGASPGTTIYIADPSGTTVSDKISVAANPATLVCPPTGGPCTFSGLQVLFTSDDSGTGSTFGTCASVGGCQITENGLVQTAVTLFSESGTTFSTFWHHSMLLFVIFSPIYSYLQ